ncbi:MAG: hypothetical protein NTU72_01715, partial [Fimbriimonadales bacterium]|nr:hypothetical protein [Fimbriimonadales bacterium]
MLLEGKKGLVLNVTNKNSIGWAIADLAEKNGAIVGVGAQNERLQEGVLKLTAGRDKNSASCGATGPVSVRLVGRVQGRKAHPRRPQGSDQ